MRFLLLEYVTNNSDTIDIVNYSMKNPYSELFEKAISESVKAGITYVVAAGNFANNATLTTSPASNPDVITESAIGDSDGKCGGLGPPLYGGRMMDDTFLNSLILDHQLMLLHQGSIFYLRLTELHLEYYQELV